MCDPRSILTGNDLRDLYRFGDEDAAVRIANDWNRRSSDSVTHEMRHAAGYVLADQTIYVACGDCSDLIIDSPHPDCTNDDAPASGRNILAQAYTGIVEEPNFDDDLWRFYGINNPEVDADLIRLIHPHRVLHLDAVA